MQVAKLPAATEMQQERSTSEHWRTWQSDADRDIRKSVINQIFTLFKNKRPSVTEEWQKRLPDFTRRLEELLYRSAKTLEDYQDPTTLSERLARVARQLAVPRPGQSTGSRGSSAQAEPSSQAGPQVPDNAFIVNRTTSAAEGGYNSRSHGQAPLMIPAPHVQQPSQPALNAPVDAPVGGTGMIPTPSMAPAAPGPMGDNRYSAAPSYGQDVSPWDPRMASGPPVQGNAGMHMQPGNDMNGSQLMANRMYSGPLTVAQGSMGSGMQMQGAPQGTSLAASMLNGAYNASHTPQQKPEQFRQQILKQQRLLLFLRHCAKCQNDNCSYGNNCRAGKELWHHIITCKHPKCPYNRCVHARELLRHYQKCRKGDCPICGPVRQFVEESKNNVTPGASRASMRSDSGVSGAPGMAMGGMHGGMQMMPGPCMGAPMLGGVPPGAMAGMRRGRDDGHMAGAMLQPEPLLEPERKRLRPVDIERIKTQLGTSLLETFTISDIQTHLQSTRDDMERLPVSKAQQAYVHPEEEVCTICQAKHILRFEPPPKNCITCTARIKKNQLYYVNFDPPATWCQQCYSAAADELHIENVVVKKAAVAENRRKHVEQEDEPWVACDVCDRWVHMICGLFNKGSNKQDTKFLCPWCLDNLQRSGVRPATTTRPQSMLGAAELPTSQLSDAIEAQLKERIETDWRQRVKLSGQPPSVVPRIEGVAVRVVNITDKIVEVKERFRRAFRDRAYPGGFPYKQKVILLFQKIEGVDILLYIVYVQEYGDNAAAPNRNTAYLSYLDSVKYFRPEAKNAMGNLALRTMVYHEILHGYMAYARALGMNALYIWSCPPLAGDDYVLYCHPHKQKNPRADKLREWYVNLLDEAQQRGVVVHRSTLFDTFLPGGKDHALMETTAMNLPYFEGDFWPGEAETQLTEIEAGKPAVGGGKKGKKGRGASGKGKRYAGPVTTDSQLVQRLVDNTVGSHQNGMKEDFIVAHFKTPCSCCTAYCDGVKWVLNKKREDLKKEEPGKTFDGITLAVDGLERAELPRHFAVCATCHAREAAAAAVGEPTRLPKQVTVADLEQVECAKLGPSIKDEDPPMDCEIFDSRTSFLSLCQGNHFQFDTLRRAKHSSMMTLYHLHNPGEPAFAGNCNVCGKDIDPGKGWRCKHKECADYEMCQECYARGEFQRHPHALVRSGVDDEFRQALTPEQRRVRQLTLRRTMMLLEHASACKDPKCPSKSCRKVKQLHQHAVQCQKKVSGGCSLCRHMWCLLNLHAKQCVRGDCPVPRCTELRELRRRQMSREQDSRRRQYMQWHRTGAGAPA